MVYSQQPDNNSWDALAQWGRRLTQLAATALLALAVSACGIKGEVIRPADIPVYEQERESRDGSLPL